MLRSFSCCYLAVTWPTSLQRWPAAPPACWEWSWGVRRCRAACCRSPSRWSLARWPWAQTAWWAQVGACTGGSLEQACCWWALRVQGAAALSSWSASCFSSLGDEEGENSRKGKKETWKQGTSEQRLFYFLCIKQMFLQQITWSQRHPTAPATQKNELKFRAGNCLSEIISWSFDTRALGSS